MERNGLRLLVLGYWALFLALFLGGGLVDRVTAAVVDLRSEYTVMEQLSKYVLLLVILTAILAYTQLRQVDEIRTGLAFLALGVTMYLAESNMIAAELAPLLGVALFVAILYLLARGGHWPAAALILLACALVGVGGLHDVLEERPGLAALLPALVVEPVMAVSEEQADTLGQGLLGAAALVRFGPLLVRWAARARLGATLYLLAAGLVAVGNSFLHYQYDPGRRLWAAALALSLAGFLGLVLTNRLLLPRAERLRLSRERHYYAFLYFVFVALPAVFGQDGAKNFLMLWFAALGYWLWSLYEPRVRSQAPPKAL